MSPIGWKKFQSGDSSRSLAYHCCGFQSCCILLGVEQAFMPAVTWHPLPALAAEVSLSGYINLGSALGAFFKDLFDHSFSLGPVIPSPNPRFSLDHFLV
jgi:hypothetical protein